MSINESMHAYNLPEGTSAHNPLILFTPLAVALGQHQGVHNVEPLTSELEALGVAEEELPLALLVRSENPHEVKLKDTFSRQAVLRPADQMGTLRPVHYPAPTLGRVIGLTKERIFELSVPYDSWSQRAGKEDDLSLSAAYRQELRLRKIEASVGSALFAVTRGDLAL